MEERPGWTRECPSCGHGIKFTKLVNLSELVPFFYSDGSNDVLLRQSDIERVKSLLEKGAASIEALEELWREIANSAPEAPNGGRFSVWANIKCPACRNEFPYYNGIRDIYARIHEPYVVLIDGAVVVDDSLEESWQVRITVGNR